MKIYWINESIITPDRESMPTGFELQIGDQFARIVVPSDVPGDKSNLYEEKIPLSQQTFEAKYYDDGNSVHIDDGELIGEEIKTVETKK